jgi:hypothetical protein
MSQSRRFCRLGLIAASSLIALIGIVPAGSFTASSSGATTTSTTSYAPNMLKGDNWCC